MVNALRRLTVGLTVFGIVLGAGLAVHDLPGPLVTCLSPEEAEAAAGRVRVGMSPEEVADVLGADGRPHPTKFPLFCVTFGPDSDPDRVKRLVEDTKRQAGYYREYRLPERSVAVHFVDDPRPAVRSVEVSAAPPFAWGRLLPWLVAGGLLGYRAMGFGRRAPDRPPPAERAGREPAD